MRPDEAQIGTAFVAQRLSTVGLARSSNRALGRRPLDGSRERSLAASGTVHSHSPCAMATPCLFLVRL